jgi:hypothetical protein
MTDLADETKLPKDRRDTCVTSDYPSISSSWMSVLAPHRREPDQPKTKIEVIYGEGKGDLTSCPTPLIDPVGARGARDRCFRQGRCVAD